MVYTRHMEDYIIILLLNDAVGVTDNIRYDAFGIDFLLLPFYILNGRVFNLILMNNFLLSKR